MRVFARTQVRSFPVALGLVLCTSAIVSAQPTTTDTSRALSIEYVDGRRVNRPLRPRSGWQQDADIATEGEAEPPVGRRKWRAHI